MNIQNNSVQATVAVVLPCFNEAAAIGAVLEEFAQALPEARVYVFDNNSTDGTAAVARAAGACVVHVARKGKGNVVRRMFADIEADVYVMVDGDATYDVSNIRQHINLLLAQRLDMVVGCRQDDGHDATYRRGHRWGNAALTGFVSWLFTGRFNDMLSGYRVFSRRYVKSFPAMAREFEIETELTVHALELRMPTAEVDIHYRARPEGSVSKLSTYRDGWRILKTISKLFISERPLAFFSIISLLLALCSVAFSIPLLLTFIETGLVPRFPTAILSLGLMLSAMLSLVCGTVLHTVTIGRQEAKHLAYLATPAFELGKDGSNVP
ncbi:Glycosyltransferase involved in cell wall bisynthesis [Lampropedia hyalina DSM 16112]|uniref:Glycosyltransferase involved in cell wall bisynthesis n=1 Tax=Lampropedia hyalina DSM 16112 TaxID=1122156 RepID=A0A1M4XRW7_9BURK|nr:glycosyltransferase family 2 protein [Lampropedia hyalina]SHE95992.1 Glycosyltransferase involved in cell wall bisynthesis [Lampropedia hyalina DSM 16112]